MSKHRGKAKRRATWVQTKRSPKNKHRWETEVNRARRKLAYAEYHKMKNRRGRNYV
ncbi:hypothetical protein NVP1015O_30 [Vibrio phage 1.015.O._10N.222.51.E5]|nr:hypothetical protein NVP1015O_30 [Vibrio phage 1.015.O._10N.222.51.E5]AUR83460.1 hypothetical protein NVP1034X_30 [Vibrio phage 1.034.X._10N.261.46.B7]AUR90198.1 hypothetical protein NVP1139A_30 [Vibrio phage 1.139.A._10N.261.48.C6]AUR90265.1 hypothetical protein NVP1139B_30 [Vibrio phage 1.139.B._10N.261.48.C6]